MSLNGIERVREIGIMRAIGALDSTLLWLFIAEGVLPGGVSWLLGMLLHLAWGVGPGGSRGKLSARLERHPSHHPRSAGTRIDQRDKQGMAHKDSQRAQRPGQGVRRVEAPVPQTYQLLPTSFICNDITGCPGAIVLRSWS